jgi:hypothetical protein
MEEILREFDQLRESKSGKAFLEGQPDKEHPALLWDILGDPRRNWLYVVVSNPARKVRFAFVTDEPGGWSIAGQLFGMDAETQAIAGKLRLFEEHEAQLLGGENSSGPRAK